MSEDTIYVGPWEIVAAGGLSVAWHVRRRIMDGVEFILNPAGCPQRFKSKASAQKAIAWMEATA